MGSLVSPNADSALLTTLARRSDLVRFAAEAEFSRLRNSEDIKVQVELADGKAYQAGAQLRRLHRRRRHGTVQMRAELPNPKAVLLPEQAVRVHVQAGTQQAFVVPQTAVAQNETGRFVWLFADGKALQRQVRTGNWLDGDWVVRDGLKTGDRVIVDNLVRLRPGIAVAQK